MLFGLFVQSAYLFFALCDLPFMLSFPEQVRDEKNTSLYVPYFDYYIRGKHHSPFLIMHERYLSLAHFAVQDHDEKDQTDAALAYYKSIFERAPQNGHVAFLISEASFLKGDIVSASKYLMDSYKLYPISGRLAEARHRLSFKILSHLPKEAAYYRILDHKTIQHLRNGGDNV